MFTNTRHTPAIAKRDPGAQTAMSSQAISSEATSNPTTAAHLVQLALAITSTVPAGTPDDQCIVTRVLIEALQPRDAKEAMVVARIIAAQQATMDSYRDAMQPGTGNTEAIRLRNNAVEAGRAFDVAMQALEQNRAARQLEPLAIVRPPLQASSTRPPWPAKQAAQTGQRTTQDAPRGNGQPGVISRVFAFALGAATRQVSLSDLALRGS
jgi:hypothetical protein